MARGFGTTYGTNGATDRVVSGTSVALSTTFSVAAWFWNNGAGGGGFGQIFSIYAGGVNPFLGIYYDNVSGAKIEVQRGWSTQAGFWRATMPTASWHHVCVTYDGSSTANVPVIYVDGVSQTVTTATAPSGTLSTITSTPVIGGDSTGAFGWDGMLAEVGFWNGSILTANEAASLAIGTLPRMIRPAGLTLYCPLYGTESAEHDWGPNHYAMTVTGALKQNHAPVGDAVLNFY
jgi:hypothetical protein